MDTMYPDALRDPSVVDRLRDHTRHIHQPDIHIHIAGAYADEPTSKRSDAFLPLAQLVDRTGVRTKC